MSLPALAMRSPQDSSQFNPLLPSEHIGSISKQPPATPLSSPLYAGLSWFSGWDTHNCGCSQLWKSGPKCTSIAWKRGVKGVVSYCVVLAFENELHHQSMQSPFWGKSMLQVSLKLPQKIWEASPRRASQELYSSWTSRLLTHAFVLFLRPLQYIPKSFIHLIIKDFIREWQFPPWKCLNVLTLWTSSKPFNHNDSGR